jgi:hypothetical protein
MGGFHLGLAASFKEWPRALISIIRPFPPQCWHFIQAEHYSNRFPSSPFWLNAPLIYKDRFMYAYVWKCRHRILSHVLYICRLYPKSIWSILFSTHWADCRLAQLLTVKTIWIYLQCLRWNGLGILSNFIFLFRFQLVLSINMSSDKRFMVNSSPSEKWQNVIDNPLASFSQVITGVPL